MIFLGFNQDSQFLLGRADPRKQPGWSFLNLCWAEAVPHNIIPAAAYTSPSL